MSDFVFFILMDIPAEYEADFNRVYDTDHLLHMVQIPGVINCTRYKLQWSDNADMLAYLALYRINDPELPFSDAWKKQGSLGRWPIDIRHRVTARSNGVYQKIFRADAKSGSGAGKESLDSDNIYFLQQAVSREIDAKFNELYNADHIPLMMQTPGVASATRYKLYKTESPDVPDHLAIYAIDSVDRPRSPEWKTQTQLGAWPQMRPNFTARRNGVYQRIGVFAPKP